MRGHVETVKDTRTMINMCLTCQKAECTGECDRINLRAKRDADRATKRREPQLYTMDGESHTVSYWANLYDIKRATLFARLKAGYDLKEALSLKLHYSPRAQTYTAFGITQTLAQWAKQTGVCKETLRYRIWKGMPLEAAFKEANKRSEGEKKQ